jgi:DNA replication and repair protein RecF
LEVRSLNLTNYRNLANLNLKFSPEGALIVGKNGIGKTNLLEAISYFAFGKSIRNRNDSELINFSKAFFRLAGDFVIHDKPISFEAAYDNSQKKIKADNVNVSKISELYKYLKVVYFSPNDIEIAQGAPQVRRNFTDMAISQQNYNYMMLMKDFQQILKQRNALLKYDFDKAEKRIWDKRFIDISAKVIVNRMKYLEEFGKILTDKYNFISGNKESITAEYICSAPLDINETLQENLVEHFDNIELKEIQNQRSLFGPHLDDVMFKLNGKPFRFYGSQGQKRSLVISARLAQAKLIDIANKEFPILIFDDVLSELDEGRTKNIIDLLKSTHQIFIATPNAKQYSYIDLPIIDMENIK